MPWYISQSTIFIRSLHTDCAFNLYYIVTEAPRAFWKMNGQFRILALHVEPVGIRTVHDYDDNENNAHERRDNDEWTGSVYVLHQPSSKEVWNQRSLSNEGISLLERRKEPRESRPNITRNSTQSNKMKTQINIPTAPSLLGHVTPYQKGRPLRITSRCRVHIIIGATPDERHYVQTAHILWGYPLLV